MHLAVLYNYRSTLTIQPRDSKMWEGALRDKKVGRRRHVLIVPIGAVASAHTYTGLNLRNKK